MVHGILPTELFPLRVEVDNANKVRLDALQTELRTYGSQDTGAAVEERKVKILEKMTAQQSLQIKVGAQVMLIKNVDGSLVNGSVGRVLGFYTPSEVCGSSGEITSKSGTGFVRGVLLRSDGKTPAEKGALEGEGDGSGVKPGQGSRSGESALAFPLVEFRTPLGKEVMLVGRGEFKVEDSDGNVLARRVQASTACVGEFRISDGGESRSR